jgi:hypothetical protein
LEVFKEGVLYILLVDRRNNFRGAPNDYVELELPVLVRFVRFLNIHTPMPHLAISDIRIFGTGTGRIP